LGEGINDAFSQRKIKSKGRKNKMKTLKNRITAIAIATFLMLSMTASIVLTPNAVAHYPAWNIPTYAYIVAAPDPIGVGQEAHVYMWLDPVYGVAGGATAAIGTNGSTASAALLSNGYRFKNYNLTIIAPDGHATTQIFETVSDTTSNQYTKFTPDQVGTYTLEFNFPGQKYGENGNGYENSILINDTYLPSHALTTLTVQDEPLPAPINSYPLPQQYWSHPIYGENTDWWTISSNWLGTGSPVPGGAASTTDQAIYHNDAIGPLTPHVVWQRPLQFGGVVGGNQFVDGGNNPNGWVPGAQYYEGTAYQPRFQNPIIISGILIYTEPIAFTGRLSGPTTAVDIRTGEVLWSRNDVPPLSFGYIYNLWDQEQHGTFPPILFTNNFAKAYDAYTGEYLFDVINVPSGMSVMGPSGEIIRYVIKNEGSTANAAWYLQSWNSSKLWQYDINPFTGGGSLSPALVNSTNNALITTNPYPKTDSHYADKIIVDANIPINSTTVNPNAPSHGLTTYDWNISIPWLSTMTPTPSVQAANYGDMMLLRSGNLPSGFAANRNGADQNPYTYFAVNLNASRGQVGSIMWTKTYNPIPGNVTMLQSAVDFDTRVFVIQLMETLQFQGYSMNDGRLLWTTEPQTVWNYYFDPGQPVLGTTAYGKFYNSGFGGITYCYDDLTGELLWTHGNGGEGNSTNGGLQVFYGVYPTMLQAIANGVVYVATDEHTMPNPFYKGALATALNATTGEEIWQLSEYPSEWGFSQPYAWATADGFSVFMNGLDNNIYSIGRGPSATSVTAQSFGDDIVIRGLVTDISAGTKQATQQAVFPNGVPVSSDASMKDWMGYVYQQKPLPTNFTGVEVTIDVLDSNGNYRNIGTATTDTTGLYSLTWTPDIPGNFLVVATFQGTNGYWPSYSETTFAVSQPHPTTAPVATAAPSMADQYILPGIVGIIVTIVIVGVVLALLMLRKRP
jgi:hypothetical protein